MASAGKSYLKTRCSGDFSLYRTCLTDSHILSTQRLLKGEAYPTQKPEALLERMINASSKTRMI